MKAQRQKKSKKKQKLTAKTADKHVLYQRAVQDTDHDIEFLKRVFKARRDRNALHFREDFCGTALLSRDWAAKGIHYTAEGFDLHEPTLAWGREHNLSSLGEAAERVTLHAKDVREASDRPADVCCAQNFSYQAFHTRAELREYFASVREHLADDGVFALDLYGGHEETEELEEEKDIGYGATYVWDQISYSPVTGRQLCAIHFRFKDGSEMERAFVYDWRHWSMVEVREMLLEVGFEHVDAYFEELDDEGDGTGVFAKHEEGLNCESWLAYLVAYK